MRKQLKLPRMLVIESCSKMKSISRLNQPTCEELKTDELREQAKKNSQKS